MASGGLGRIGAVLRRVDPCGPLVALLSLAVFLARGFDGKLSRDLAVYAYGAQQAADGVPPYVGILTRAGPLGQLVPGIGAWVGEQLEVDQLLAMRVLMMLISVCCVWVLYCLGRDLTASRAAGVVAALSMLAFDGFALYATGGPREKSTMLLFLACCLWAVARRRWGWAGVALAMATLSWQPVFVAGAAATVVAIALLPDLRSALRALVRFAAGGVLTLGLCVLAFALAGALDEFVEGFVLVNAEYTRQSGLAGYWRWRGPGDLETGFGLSLWLLAFGLATIVLAACLRLRSAVRQREQGDVAVVACGAAALGALGWSLRAFNGWSDGLVLLPMAALGVGWLAQALLPRRLPRPVRVSLVGAVAVSLLVSATTSAVQGRTDELAQQRESTQRILDAAPDDASIWSIASPQPLVLVDRSNPTRYQMFGSGLTEYTDEAYPGGLDGLIASIERDRPTFITLRFPRQYKWLKPMLRRDYRFVAASPGWRWFVRRDLGEDVFARIRAAAPDPSPQPPVLRADPDAPAD